MAAQTQISPKDFFAQVNVKQKFEELLGKRSTAFIASVLQIINSSDLLKNADPMSIFSAAATAATLDLPLNNSLGFAYIVPFNDRKSGKVLAQFQIGYRAYIQLAQRSGQFEALSDTPVYEGQIISENPLTGYEFDFSIKNSREVIGYAAYFRLLNGFEKTLYMTKQELQEHGKKYSQTFKKGFGLWQDDFDAMARKTVIKLLLSKYAPLSVEMQIAQIADQSVISKIENGVVDVSYVDNQELTPVEIDEDKERVRCSDFIKSCTTTEKLITVQDSAFGLNLVDLYESKLEELKQKP